MTRIASTALAGALALAWLATGAPAAHAADEVSIDLVQSEGSGVRAVVSLDGVPPTAQLDEETVGATVDGTPVDVTVKTVAAGDVERTTMIALDASNSMRGAKYEAAMTAIDAYLETVPADVRVGLVAFAGKLTATVEPSTDREELISVLEDATLTGGTHVYDAVLEAVGQAGDEGVRSVLLVSDGRDTGSSATQDEVIGAAADTEAVVDVVPIGAEAAELAAIAEGTGGQVVPADPAALTAVLTEQADVLANQLLVSFDLPEGVSGEADITITVDAGGGQTYTDSALTVVDTSAAIPELDLVETGEALVDTPLMLVGAGALLVGLVGVLYFAFGKPAGGSSVAERRVEAYFAAAGDTPAKSRRGRRARAAADTQSFKQSAVSATEKVMTQDFETRIAQRLTGAGSALTASEWILLHAGIVVGAAVVGAVMGGGVLAVLAAVLGLVLPWSYLKFRHGRRLSAFNAQLAQTLGLMAGGLQAGLSLPQAVDTVVREGHEPMAGELRRALVEQRLGVDIADALEGVGERMESADFAWVVMAIRIQREVGGNLAEILHTVAETLREREYLRRQVKALSAEGRLSGYILTGMPPLIFFYMTFANPSYVALLYTTFPGYIIIAVAVLLLAFGSFAMNKLAKVEV